MQIEHVCGHTIEYGYESDWIIYYLRHTNSENCPFCKPLFDNINNSLLYNLIIVITDAIKSYKLTK